MDQAAEPPSSFPDDRPDDRPDERPEDRPDDRPDDRPEDRPDDRPEDRPDDRPAIADYALLSNCRGAALASKGGSIDWACLPSFDSPATFARILGRDAGHWLLCPTESFESERAYLPGTMVLRTVFRTASGTVALTDALELEGVDHEEEIGHGSPPVLLRVVECLSGEVEMRADLAPRPEYGMTTPMLIQVEGGLVSRGGPQAYVVSTQVAYEETGATARARFTLSEGEQKAFALHEVTPWARLPPTARRHEIVERLEKTTRVWQNWSERHDTKYDGPYTDAVTRSALVLQALQYAKTGAIVAAPTTSLPESLGGTRNWDYRFAWARDASLTVGALADMAHHYKANSFFDFFVTAASGLVQEGHCLQILYGIHGERHVPETELSHLDGYRASRPVRVGNGAWSQRQLDIFGELLDAAWTLARHKRRFDLPTTVFLRDLAHAAAQSWPDPDSGIWEVRGGPRHFVYSKLMCWVALDRAVHLAEKIGASPSELAYWDQTRAAVRSAIEERGWSDTAGAFVQAFDSHDLDAAALMIPIVGFLPGDDPRVRSTTEAIATHLTDERGFVYRYRSADGLDGTEGTFGICTYWLVTCLAMGGEVDRARSLFERMTACANDVGLLSEQVGKTPGELLGNFPQAFTHIGLLRAALAIEEAASLG